MEDRGEFVEVAPGNHGEIGKTRVLPPETVAPLTPVGVEVRPAGVFGVHGEDGAVEFDGIVAATGAGGHPALQDVGLGDAGRSGGAQAFLGDNFAVQINTADTGDAIGGGGDVLPFAGF